MTHAHTRTSLARYGFSDPDRKLPRHDLACLYLREKIDQIGRLAFEGWRGVSHLELEHWIGKQARLDLYARGSVPNSVWRVSRDVQKYNSKCLAIEVKITPVNLGDVIAQMSFYQNLYKQKPFCEFADKKPSAWFLVTDYPVTALEAQVLNDHGVKHLKLGPDFESFVRAKTSEPAGGVEI